MGGKSSSQPAPPTPPPPPEPQFDPSSIMEPLIASMNQMMNSFAQQQSQMFQFLVQNQPEMPNIDDYDPGGFDLEEQRARIEEKLSQNPTQIDQMQRGPSSTRRVSPLESEDEVDILNITPRRGERAASG